MRMRVVLAELRNMFSLRAIVILVLLTGLNLWLFVGVEYRWYRTYEGIYNLNAAAELVELYGTEISPEERFEIEDLIMRRNIEVFERVIAESEVLAERGITTYDEFYEFRWGPDRNRDAPELIGWWTFSPYDQSIMQLRFDLRAFDVIMYVRYGLIPDYYVDNEVAISTLLEQQRDFYENIESGLGLNPREAARVREIVYVEGQHMLPAHEFYTSINNTAILAAVMSIIAIYVLTGYVQARDRISNITEIQYASKSGRRTLGRQLAASLVASVIITAVQLAVVGVLLVGVVLRPFLGCQFKTSVGGLWLWFGGTIGQYLLVVAGMVFLLTVAFTLIIFFLSKYSGSYVSVVMRGVFAVPAFGYASYLAVIRAFELLPYSNLGRNVLYDALRIPFVEVYFCLLLLVAAVPFVVFALRKFGRCDV